MISSFKQYLVEERKSIYFTWGRMNPPTIGHEKLLEKLSRKAGSNPYRVYLTQSNDPKKNPLKYVYKIKTARKMFPRHARSIMFNKKIRTVFDVLTSLYNEGFKDVNMVVGSDRIREFDILLKKYNNKKSKHGFYNFQSINVISAGERDPDADGATGMSASKMRLAAEKGDFTSFAQGIPKNVSNKDSKSLYNVLRNGMGLKEQKFFKKHLKLGTVSEEREKYIRGYSFQVDDEVIIKETGEIGKILICGSNYVIVEVNDMKFRKWLKDIEKIEEAKVITTGPSGLISTTRTRGSAPGLSTNLSTGSRGLNVQKRRKATTKIRKSTSQVNRYLNRQRQNKLTRRI